MYTYLHGVELTAMRNALKRQVELLQQLEGQLGLVGAVAVIVPDSLWAPHSLLPHCVPDELPVLHLIRALAEHPAELVGEGVG